MRKCTLCILNEIGSEFHVLMLCTNSKLKQLRTELNDNINQCVIQWNLLPIPQKFTYLVSAVDKNCNFYFSIFLDKVFKEI